MRLGTRQTRYAPVQRECGRSLAESRRLTGPAGDIMLAARPLFERQGVAKTTVKDLSLIHISFHAETKLVIDGGTVDVTSCYEGYEAEKIYVNGGETHIVASDDAVNAAAADLSGDEADATATTTDARVAESFDPAATGEMSDGAEPPAMDAGAMPQDGAMPGGMGGAMGEREQNGGMPDNAFAEGGAPTMGDENCLIQVNGGYTVLDAAGDAVDSNGSVEVTRCV